MKLCRMCNQAKPIGEFYVNRSAGKTHQSICKPCGAVKARAWRAKNRSKTRLRDTTTYAAARWNSHLKRKYGIDSREFAAMLAEQGEKCAICRADSAALLILEADQDATAKEQQSHA